MMKKNEYKEPVFTVVTTSEQDVITTSGDTTPNYTPSPFEGPIIGL